MNRLSASGVQNRTEPGICYDGNGLRLIIGRSGSKSWVYRYQIDGRRRDMGLGPYPRVSLAEARQRAAEQRTIKADGVDPLAQKRDAAAATKLDAAKATGRMLFSITAETTQLYRHFNGNGDLLYVGIASNPFSRLSKHQDSGWFYEIAVVTLEHFSTRAEAEAAEYAAIVRENPRYNVSGGTRVEARSVRRLKGASDGGSDGGFFTRRKVMPLISIDNTPK